MQFSFKDFKLTERTRPLYYRSEESVNAFSYQQWQYELSLIDQSLFRLQSLQGLSARPFKLIVKLYPDFLEVKYGYFNHTYVVSSEPINTPSEALIEEAFNGSVYSKGHLDFWFDTDSVELSETITVRAHYEPYNGSPYNWELRLLLIEQLRRQEQETVLPGQMAGVEESLFSKSPFLGELVDGGSFDTLGDVGANVDLTLYRPLTAARIRLLPDQIINTFTPNTKTVEGIAQDVIFKLRDNPNIGFTSSHALDNYTLDYMPEFSFDEGLAAGLFNTMISTMQIEDFTGASLDETV